MYSLKTTNYLFASIFSLLLIFSSAYGQVKKSDATAARPTNGKTIIECYDCHGKGVSIFYVLCKNCSGWSDEYRSKVPCHSCKDKRRIWEASECSVCKGDGKIAVTPEELKLVAKIKEQQKKEEEEQQAIIKAIPKHDGVMTDAEATALYNAHYNPGAQKSENPITILNKEEQEEKERKHFDSLVKKIAIPVEETEDQRRYDAYVKLEYMKAQLVNNYDDYNLKYAVEQESSSLLNQIAWESLLEKDFKKALQVLELGMQLSKETDETYPYLLSNIAHAYLFNNEYDKAHKIYFGSLNRSLNNMTWKEGILLDFKEFRQKGIKSTGMDKIEEEFKSL